jgi:group I intron endonuclease
MIIYKAINLKNNKMYIGMTTKSLNERIYKHFYDSRRKDRKQTYFSNAILKYGADSFKFIIIDKAETIEELNLKEQFWINFYKSNIRLIGYNLDSGGKTCYKAESTKLKISTIKKQNWKNKELSERMLKGLKKGTKVWQIKSKLNRKELICIHCQNTYKLPTWETKNRKYCSFECMNKDPKKIESNLKALQLATMKNKNVGEQKRKDLKLFVEQWALINKNIIIDCKYNAIETGLKVLLEEVKNNYQIKDIRSILFAFCNNLSRKEFLKSLKSFVKMYADPV